MLRGAPPPPAPDLGRSRIWVGLPRRIWVGRSHLRSSSAGCKLQAVESLLTVGGVLPVGVASTVGSNGALLETLAATRAAAFILELRPARRSISAQGLCGGPGRRPSVPSLVPPPRAATRTWSRLRRLRPLPGACCGPSNDRLGGAAPARLPPQPLTRSLGTRPLVGNTRPHRTPSSYLTARTHTGIHTQIRTRADARKTTTATYTQIGIYARACYRPGWEAGVPRTACRGRPLGSRRRLGRHVSSGVKATHIK